MEILKENRVQLTDEERATCLKEKAVWHHGPNGEETPAVWKSKNSKGEITYVTNTHRAYQTAPTLEGAINKFHDFIKSTAFSSVGVYKEAQFDSFEDVIYSVDEAREDIMREYYRKGRKRGTMMSWSVVPYSRLKKIWSDYAKLGIVRDEAGLREISNHILRNLARLQAATELGGHSQMNPDEMVKEMGFKPIGPRNDDFYFSFLETKYGTPISDYGLPKLWELANQLMSKSTAEEKLIVLDQMLNVIHQRGDLAALFIEGGSSSLTDLSSAPSEEQKEPVEASVKKTNWYKVASVESDIKDVKNDVKDAKKDTKDLDKRVKDLEKAIDSLNIGSRRFYQQQSIFTSLQRKIERFEKMTEEWTQYKKEMDDKVKRLVEKHTKGEVRETKLP